MYTSSENALISDSLNIHEYLFRPFNIIIIIAIIGCYVNAYHFFPILSYLILIIGIATIIYDDILGMKLFLLSLIISDDFPKYFSKLNPVDFNSIYTIKVFGNTMIMVWTSVVLAKILFRECILNRFTINTLLHSNDLKTILFIFITSIFWGLQNVYSAPKYYINDLSFILNILVGIYLSIVLIDSKEKIKSFFLFFLFVASVKYVLVIVDSIIMSLSTDLYTLKAESGAYLSIIPLSFFIIHCYRQRSARILDRNTYLFLLSGCILSIAYNVVTASRGRFIILTLALIGAIIITKRYSLFFVSLAVIISIITCLFFINPKFIGYALWKVSTVNPTSEDSASSSVRATELNNIFRMQIDKLYLLPFGTGLGGHFTSRYEPFRFELLGGDAYQDEWIIQDKFFKPHGTILFVILKFGVVGFLLLYYSIFSITIRSLNYYLNINDTLSDIYIVLSLSLPLLFIVNFTPKTQILSGLILGVLLTKKYVQRDNESGHNINCIQ